MQALFSPATALMSRMRYTSKFAVLGAAVAVVIAVLLMTVFSHLQQDIRIARNELAGVQMLKPMNRMVQSMQQHRGLSAGVLGGNEAMKEKRVAKEKEASDMLAQTDAALSEEMRSSTAWKAVKDDWQAIVTQGLTWTAADNIKRHTGMIDKILLYMVEVADKTEMTLDPFMDGFYLMDTITVKMPAMLERMGQTRARGTAVLAKKEISQQMKIDMGGTLAEMNSTLRAQNINLDKVMSHAPSTQTAVSPAAKAFTADSEKIFSLVREDIIAERFLTPSQDYFALTSTLLDSGYKVMFETLFPEFERLLSQRIQDAQQRLSLNVGLAVLVLALVGYLAMGTYYSVVNSVTVFSNGARRMAEGDLTANFDTGGADELQAAGDDFNNMATSMRKLLGRIQGDVRDLRGAAEQLATSSQQIANSAGAQSDAASSMAATIEEMTVGVDNIARNAKEAQGYSHQSDRVAAEGGVIVQGVVNEIQRIAETVNESASAVEALGDQSNQISAIVGTIKDIADQTNLLALNAAIEAARAGESGRGFAVVADEVRKLAERTAKSTQEISSMIGSIQTGTSTAVHSMKQGVDRVASGVEQAQLAGTSILQVQSQSQQVVGAVEDISISLGEQATASSVIAQNVEKIAQMAEENNAAAANNADTAQKLSRLAEGLNAEVSRFKT